MVRQARMSFRSAIVWGLAWLGLVAASSAWAEPPGEAASHSGPGAPDLWVGAELDREPPRVFSAALPFEVADAGAAAPSDFDWQAPLSAAIAIPTRVALIPQRALCLAVPCRPGATRATRDGTDILSPSRTSLRAMVDNARLEVGEAWSLKPSLRWMQSVSRAELDKLRGLLTRNGPRIPDAQPLVLLDLNLRYRASEHLAFDVFVNNVAESDGVQLYTSEFGGRETGHRTVSVGVNYDF